MNTVIDVDRLRKTVMVEGESDEKQLKLKKKRERFENGEWRKRYYGEEEGNGVVQMIRRKNEEEMRR